MQVIYKSFWHCFKLGGRETAETMLNVGGSVYVTSMCFTRRVQTCYESIQKLDYQMHDRESEFKPLRRLRRGFSHLSCLFILPADLARASGACAFSRGTRCHGNLLYIRVITTAEPTTAAACVCYLEFVRELLPLLHNHFML